ncbi:MAG: ABC-F family ATP-binding cassette domain-containing protein [Rickettsiales bacterium]
MLQIKNLSKSYRGKVILDEISYKFPSNKIIGLIGVNGAGKTTLLNIICGIDEADNGEVVKSKTSLLSYLKQTPNFEPAHTIIEECISGAKDLFKLKVELDEIAKKMEEVFDEQIYERFEKVETEYRLKGGYALEGDAEKILKGLGFKQSQMNDDPKSLSGGWRMRLELAKILLEDPDFLILDEPTNHLDLPSIMWLEDYLQKFKGTLIFISHDEDLLNRLPEVIVYLKNGQLSEYYGNYDDFLEQYQQEQEGKIAQVENTEKKIKQLSRFVDRFKASASKATQARSKMKVIAKLQTSASGINVDKASLEMNVKIPLTHKSGHDVLHLTDSAIGYNDKPLLKNIELFVERGQKVAIVGANGLGKSTFMKSIFGLLPFVAGNMKLGHNVKMAYYAQEQLEFLNAEKTVLENLMDASTTITEGKARSLLGNFLLRGDDVYKQVKVLSGGEKSRLSLACMLVQDVNFLLLDEPTNHLDMMSTEVLASALSNYEGTVMFISHNRKFINSVATDMFIISQSAKTYKSAGNLDEVDLEKFN